jgi:hypothetical protein
MILNAAKNRIGMGWVSLARWGELDNRSSNP